MRSLLALLLILLVMESPGWALKGPALEAWQEDLALLLKQFPERDKSLTPQVHSEFSARVESLQARLPEMDELHVIIGVMQAVAVAGNAHTAARPNVEDPRFGRVPIGLHWFSDGVYVVKARPEHGDLLRGKLLTIGGHTAEELLAGLRTVFYGNDSWRRFVGADMMAIPGLLYGLDLIADPTAFLIAVETPGGAVIEKTLTVEQKSPADRDEAWWDLAPPKERIDPNWIYAFDPVQTPTPLYLKDPNTAFWTEYIEESSTLYVQYNSSVAQSGVTPRDNRSLMMDQLK